MEYMGICKERKWGITHTRLVLMEMGKGQKSYHPVIAFVAETKEILHSWFRCGSAYTSNGIVEFMKECMAYMKRRVRVTPAFAGAVVSSRESCWITWSQYQRDTLSR